MAKVLHPQRGYGFKPRVAGLPSEAAKREGGSRAEATLGTPDPGYPNPNGVASVPESILDVFFAPALAMKHEISGGFSGSAATPLGLMEFLVPLSRGRLHCVAPTPG